MHFFKVTTNDKGFGSLFKCSKDLPNCEMFEVNETSAYSLWTVRVV